MSIISIKQALETHLNSNVTTKAIKWFNTSIYTLNGTTLSQSQIDALTEFIEPKIVPISEDREVFSSNEPFKYEVFFQIDIYTRANTGTGLLYETIDTLNQLFKEQRINNVVCDMTETLNGFESGEWYVTPIRIRAHEWDS